MHWLDWLILLIPLALVMGMAWHSRRYVRDVADYLSAGRVCGRYVICIADVANALSVIGLVGYVEVQYKVGFALAFWQNLLAPLGLFLSLAGYCIYRFRETRAQTLGQFLEMRYSRSLRVFAAGLRSLSEMLANMIVPAVSARFFIYYLDLPHSFGLFGLVVPSYMAVIVLVLALAVAIILMGGTLSITITDTLQGLFFYPVLAIFVVFVLCGFSWSGEIMPVMMDRASGESFLNPYEVSELRDFNLFMLIVTAFSLVLHRASWIGAANSSSAKTPHEQKMASILGTWREGFTRIFYLLLAVTIITTLNHRNFSGDAKQIRDTISTRVAEEVVADEALRQRLAGRIADLPEHNHTVGADAPLSQARNLDTPYLDAARETLEGEAGGNARFQEFRTLYHQLMLPVTMRHLLPAGLMGLFCLLMVFMMLSTDNTRIFSAAQTIAQDIILPFKKGGFTPQGHVRLLRWTSVGVGLFWMTGSFFMAQLDYIQLFITIVTSMWMGGCGPVMVFGLYSRFGTTAGAFASLVSGAILSLGGILVQRNWAGVVYPWLERMELVEPVSDFLAAVSGPLNPIVVWKMDPVKLPINSYEIYFMIMVFCLALYIGVSLLTRRAPFNLDRMLHRGEYDVEGDHRSAAAAASRPFRSVFAKLIGITPEYTKGDRIIAWSVFLYNFVYSFLGAFVFVVVYNRFSPWPMEWWGRYFFVVFLLVPGMVAAVSTVWFMIGGLIDLRRLFRDLRARVVNPLDDGRVEGNMSLADKDALEAVDDREKAGDGG